MSRNNGRVRLRALDWRALAALAVLVVAAPGAVAAKQPGAWSPAVLEVGINSPQADGCPIESPKGLDLYFASTRPGAVGGDGDPNDIWRVSRAAIEAPWGTPEHLPAPVNSAAADFCPTPLSGDNLYFVSSRAGFCGAGDIFRTREHPTLGWLAPENLGCNADGGGPNFAGGEFSPSVVSTDSATYLFFSSTGLDGLDQDIYVTTMDPDGTFGPATLIAELSTAGVDQMPNVSRDGLEMVFVSDRTGTLGALDVWVTTRSSIADTWSTPVNLGPNVNSALAESRPSLSGDGRRLHFGRAGDIWVSSRNVGNAHD